MPRKWTYGVASWAAPPPPTKNAVAVGGASYRSLPVTGKGATLMTLKRSVKRSLAEWSENLQDELVKKKVLLSKLEFYKLLVCVVFFLSCFVSFIFHTVTMALSGLCWTLLQTVILKKNRDVNKQKKKWAGNFHSRARVGEVKWAGPESRYKIRCTLSLCVMLMRNKGGKDQQ